MLIDSERKARPDFDGPDGAKGSDRQGEAVPSKELLSKLARLKDIIEEMGSVLVAFSGGVDSGFLLSVAALALKGRRVAALTAKSPTYLDSELKEAELFAKGLDLLHRIVDSNELEIENFAENSPKRCYYCKSELFKICLDSAKELGLAFVADGTNTDDLLDYRPGLLAAKELGVRSPLVEAGLAKADIRELGRYLGVSTWDKPALACLSSRFPYGTRITEERLKKVKEGEAVIRGLGFKVFRVRYHGDTARIEVAQNDIARLLDDETRGAIVEGFKRVGFVYVSLDLQGYRSGSMNEVL